MQTSLDTTEYEKDLDSTMTKLGVEGITYLQARNLQGVHAETEVNVSLSIANLILYSWTVYPEPFHQLFSEQISEVSLGNSLRIRASIDHNHTTEIRTTIRRQHVECAITGRVDPHVSGPRSPFD